MEINVEQLQTFKRIKYIDFAEGLTLRIVFEGSEADNLESVTLSKIELLQLLDFFIIYLKELN